MPAADPAQHQPTNLETSAPTATFLSPEDAAPVDAMARAQSDVHDIWALKRTKPFWRYFMREPAEKVAEIEKKLTDADHPLRGKQRNIALGELRAWRRIVRKIDDDLTGNCLILKIDPTEKVAAD